MQVNNFDAASVDRRQQHNFLSHAIDACSEKVTTTKQKMNETRFLCLQKVLDACCQPIIPVP